MVTTRRRELFPSPLSQPTSATVVSPAASAVEWRKKQTLINLREEERIASVIAPVRMFSCPRHHRSSPSSAGEASPSPPHRCSPASSTEGANQTQCRSAAAQTVRPQPPPRSLPHSHPHHYPSTMEGASRTQCRSAAAQTVRPPLTAAAVRRVARGYCCRCLQ